MLRFLTQERSSSGLLTRREWLRLGGLTGLGLTGAFSARVLGKPSAAPETGFGKAKSIILIYTGGGQSQLDTWDPKPAAPREIRGAFQSMVTAVPGIRLCEHLPRVAQAAKLFTIVRSVSHEDSDHGSATYLSLTGNYHARRSGNPPVNLAEDLPTLGAILHRVRPERRLPFSAVHVNAPVLAPLKPAPGQFAGRLGAGCEPCVVGDPTDRENTVLAMEPRAELPPVRQEGRRSLLHAIDRYAASLPRNRALMEMDAQYRKAYDFLSSRQGRLAFDLDHEPGRVRDRYGRHRSGQACLLARRLVEAGVPWITVMWNHMIRGQDQDGAPTDIYGWDTHNDIFDALQHHLLPRFDQSFSALLNDLNQRGLLDQTLVVCMGEFGRHPQVAREATFAGSSPGRKHWPSCYSIVLAGAGVRRGATFGESDRHAASPRAHPVGPWDVAATMFHALGVDPRSHYHDLSQRPFPISAGKPFLGVFG
ncbi:MAG TPA: DUF1501 domain-containing protein [Gemmataceae bacterium]|nr:DUF1501 domain-containing protein [Gemmataceae bacterium]